MPNLEPKSSTNILQYFKKKHWWVIWVMGTPRLLNMDIFDKRSDTRKQRSLLLSLKCMSDNGTCEIQTPIVSKYTCEICVLFFNSVVWHSA